MDRNEDGKSREQKSNPESKQRKTHGNGSSTDASNTGVSRSRADVSNGSTVVPLCEPRQREIEEGEVEENNSRRSIGSHIVQSVQRSLCTSDRKDRGRQSIHKTLGERTR